MSLLSRALVVFCAILFVIGALSADELTFAVDRLHERYYFGQYIGIGVFIQNQTADTVMVRLTATTDLPKSYYLSEDERQYLWAIQGVFASRTITLPPKQAEILLLSPMRKGWNLRDSDFSDKQIEFTVTVGIKTEGVIEQRTIKMTVEEPTSKRGKEILQYVLDNKKSFYNISNETVMKMLPTHINKSVAEEIGVWVNSEYSHQMIASTATDQYLDAWIELVENGSEAATKSYLRDRAVTLGDPDFHHPAICLAIATAAIRSTCEDQEMCEDRMRSCAESNSYFEALAEYLISYARTIEQRQTSANEGQALDHR
jgi:hypothetical protein